LKGLDLIRATFARTIIDAEERLYSGRSNLSPDGIRSLTLEATGSEAAADREWSRAVLDAAARESR